MGARRGFSLAELLVVIGILCLLIAILAAPLRLARRHAMAGRCGTQLQQIGVALEDMRTDYEFYPIWDDGGSPVRYTWLDVLVENGQLNNVKVGYCPEDPWPNPLNTARAIQQGVLYPGRERPGIDYSYGITMPLSAGGWATPLYQPPDTRARRFENHDRFAGQRVLAADANWSQIYNLSGDALTTNDWAWPTQFDNMVAWRHLNLSANLLYQDGHVGRVSYKLDSPEPVNTALTCVWYPGEPLHLGPENLYQQNWYPNRPPIDLSTGTFRRGAFPFEVVPGYYTRNLLWTRVSHDPRGS
jgi:prepilin-type N-terminal cleavage/methylation domain-containing protein/prepilin-type processing-associated H-X9-DG protein